MKKNSTLNRINFEWLLFAEVHIAIARFWFRFDSVRLDVFIVSLWCCALFNRLRCNHSEPYRWVCFFFIMLFTWTLNKYLFGIRPLFTLSQGNITIMVAPCHTPKRVARKISINWYILFLCHFLISLFHNWNGNRKTSADFFLCRSNKIEAC